MITENIQEQKQLRDCRACKLWRERVKSQGRVILGAGPVPADLAFVGMGGGAEEAATGRPLVGPAGIKLNQMMTAAGIDPLNVFRTNIVLCRCPENRAPEQDELDTCRPFVTEELKRVQPKVIVAAGAQALKYFTRKVNVSALVGEAIWNEPFNCWIIPIFHPAYLLRKSNPADEKRNVDALVTAKALSQGKAVAAATTTGEHTRTKIIQSVDEAQDFFSFLKDKPEVAFDFETTSLQLHTLLPLCVGFSWKPGRAVVLPIRGQHATELWDIVEYAELVRLLTTWAKTDALKIGANVMFDALCFRRMGITLRGPWYDVQAAHHLLDEVASHELDDLSWLVGMGGYKRPVYEAFNVVKALQKKKKLPVKEASYSEIPTELLWPYNGNDCDCTFRLKQLFVPMLTAEGMDPIANNLTMPLHVAFADTQWHGVAVDQKYMTDLGKVYEDRAKEIERQLESHEAVKRTVELLKARAVSRLKAKRKPSVEGKPLREVKVPDIVFKPGSADQLQVLFFEVLKLRGGRRGKKGYSTDKDAMESLVTQHEIPALIGEYRKMSKLKSTYVDGLLKSSAVDGRAHTSYNLNGTETGRISCLTASAMVEIKGKGRMSIQDVRAGDEIRTAWGFQKVLAQQCTADRARVVRLRTETGKVICATDTHRFACQRPDTPSFVVWKPVKLFMEGDVILTVDGAEKLCEVWPLKDQLAVYDISVEGEEFLANGFVSHNSSQPNLMNIPGEMSGRKEEVRNIFVARPGYTLIESDYKQAEFRIWASYSRDPLMLQSIADGVDVHTENASLAYGKDPADVTKTDRSFAKTLTFGSMYGRGARSIALQFKMPEEEAERIRLMILARYPKAKRWLADAVIFARQHGYTQTAFGRRRHLADIKSLDERARAGAERAAINSPIQGTAGDLTNLAVLRSYTAIHGGVCDPTAPKVWDADIVLQVHDCIVWEVLDAQADAFAREVIVPSMTRPMPGITVPMAIDIKAGKRWGSLVDYEVS